MVRFTLVINGLVRAVVARSGSRVMSDAMIMLLTGRIVALSHVVRRLVLAIQTGTLRTRRSPAPGCTRRPAAKRAVVLPRGNAWLVKLMGSDAVASGLYLQAVIADPEMVALLAASPRLRRTLRPLCRMLGVAMPMPPEPVPPPQTPPTQTPAPPVGNGTAEAASRTGGARTGGGDVGASPSPASWTPAGLGAVENAGVTCSAFLRSIRSG